MDHHEHPAWELGMSLFLVLLGLAVIVLSNQFPKMDGGQPGPSLFPQVLATGLIVGGLTLVVSSLRDLRRLAPGTPLLASRAGLLRLLATLLIAGMVPALMPLLTLTGASALAAALFTALIGAGWKNSLLVGVVTAAIIYGLFGRLLGVPLS